MSKPPAALTMADFEPLNGDSFGVEGAENAVTLKLVNVARLGNAQRDGGAFSLLFVSAAEQNLPQSTYALSHPVLGTHEIFLVPLGRADGGNSYEAIFG